MDELSMMFVLSNISIFLFVSMCVFAYHNRERTGFKIIIYSSGIYSISIILFYFDVKYLLLGRPSAILTFITCLFVFTGITLFVRSLTQLYQIKSVFKISVCILFIIVTSALMTVLTIYDEYFWRTVVFYIGIILPLIVALYYQKKSSLTTMFNLISSQIYLIFFVIGLNTIYFLLYDQELDFTNPPEFSKIFLMIVNILIITLIFSFIVEKNGQDIKELHEKGELLENMFFKVKLDSETDELTQLFNRRKINQILDSLLKNTKRTGTPFSILLVDIDQFKSINDTYSHQIGDEVLKFISKTLCDLTRDADFIGRMGGDEFIIVLTNTNYEKCLNVKHKIQSFHKNYSTKDLDVQVNLSIGCAQSDPELTNDEIIHNADIELYEEKHRKYKN